MSPRTTILAKLFGLYLVAISLAMFARMQTIVAIMASIIQDPPLLFVCGLLGISGGLAIVLSHNVWRGGLLPIVLTLFGWAALIKGMLLLLLSPETESRVFFSGIGYERYPYLFAAVLLFLGGYLTYAGFNASSRLTPE
jgi:hypothetical protein